MIKEVRFGGTSAEQTHLANLVLLGSKTATSSLRYFQDIGKVVPTNVGDIWTILDGDNNQVCQAIVEAVTYQTFGSVTSDFAIAEGDETFENWHEIHFTYYTQLLNHYNQKLTADTVLECVYFKKIVPQIN